MPVIQHPPAPRIESEQPFFSRPHPEIPGVVLHKAVQTQSIESAAERINEVWGGERFGGRIKDDEPAVRGHENIATLLFEQITAGVFGCAKGICLESDSTRKTVKIVEFHSDWDFGTRDTPIIRSEPDISGAIFLERNDGFFLKPGGVARTRKEIQEPIPAAS